MNWMMIGADLISMILCAIILNCYFSIFGTKKTNKKIIIVSHNLIYIALGLVCNMYIQNQIIHIVVMFILTIAYSFLFKIGVAKLVYSTLSIQIIVIFGEFLFSLLLATILGIPPKELGSNIIVYLTAVGLSKVTIYAIIKPLSLRKSNKSAKMPKQIVIGFVILPITSFVVMFYMAKTMYVTNDLTTKIIGFLISLLLLSSNIVIFFLFEKILQIKDKEQEMLKKTIILENEKQYYSDLYNKQSVTDKTMHDMKHKFFAFKETLDKDVDKAKEMVDNLYEELNTVNALKITNKPCVDSLLNSKIVEAKKHNIDIKINSLLTDKIEIDDIDLCVILGNLLDNSIEACNRDYKNQNKWIYVRFMQDENNLVIKIKNTYNEDVPVQKTSKKDKLHHGFGVQNVEEVVKKYNGYCLIEKTNNVYCTSIIFDLN